jgi:hypothetical protein
MGSMHAARESRGRGGPNGRHGGGLVGTVVLGCLLGVGPARAAPPEEAAGRAKLGREKIARRGQVRRRATGLLDAPALDATVGPFGTSRCSRDDADARAAWALNAAFAAVDHGRPRELTAPRRSGDCRPRPAAAQLARRSGGGRGSSGSGHRSSGGGSDPGGRGGERCGGDGGPRERRCEVGEGEAGSAEGAWCSRPRSSGEGREPLERALVAAPARGVLRAEAGVLAARAPRRIRAAGRRGTRGARENSARRSCSRS